MSAMTRGLSPAARKANSPETVMDPYKLESKALSHWDKQRRVWDNLSLSLARRTGTRPNGTTNFSTATAQAREQIEDFSMIQSAVPQAELSNYYAWESLLRCTDASKAVRYVQIGKAYYPYAIFGEVEDTSSLKPSNPTYIRIVQDQQSRTAGSARRSEAREAVRQLVALGDDKESVQEFMLAESDRSRRKADYYRNQVLKFSSHIQKKFPHFLVPRQFLHVEGQRAPRSLSAKEHEEIERRELDNPPEAVQFIPPPQNVRLPVMTPMSTDNAAIRVTNEQSGVLNPNNAPSFVGAVAEVTDSESLMRRGPALAISTRRLLFRGYPGELVHGHIRLKNTSSVTVYYSWMPVDLINEALRESEQRERTSSMTPGVGSPSMPSGTSFTSHPPLLQLPQLSAETGKPMSPPSGLSSENSPGILVGADPMVLQHSRKLHAMATRCKKAQSFFRLSSPINGVVLPDESELFPFSMRAPHEGCFKHTYELLTIPPSPDRILIELCGLVSSAEPTADSLSSPIGAVLEEKASQDAQRHLVQSLVHTTTPYIGSDIDQEMRAIERRKEEAQKAKVALREQQKERWKAYNEQTYDAIPYHPIVFDKFRQLFRNLDATMTRLDSPLHHHDWDGSLTYLLVDIGRLRDAASRSVLLEGFEVLLRAARVAKDRESETLESLLRHATDALAELTRSAAEEQLRHEVEFAQYPREALNVMNVGKTKRGGAAGSAGVRKHTPTGREGKENYVVTGAYRTPAVSLEPEEQDQLQAEYDLLFADQLEVLKERTEQRKEVLFRHFQHVIDLACELPLLDVVQGCRVKDIYTIQHIEEMEVDNGSEVMPQKIGKGKR